MHDRHDKYEAALKIKPDYHEVLYNWASALDDQARTKKGKQAQRLRQLANEKLAAAREIAPGIYPGDDEVQITESSS